MKAIEVIRETIARRCLARIDAGLRNALPKAVTIPADDADAILAALAREGLAVERLATIEDLCNALEDFIDHEVDYVTRNNLGDPEKLGRVIHGRNAIAAARKETDAADSG